MQVHESYATAADGTNLWWRSAGHGSPAIALCDGIGCSGWIWRELFPRLAQRWRVIHWNYRGHGRSERPHDLDRTSMLDCAADLFAVLDAAGERRAVLVGHSMGVQVCLEAHRQHAARVRALGLLCGAPGRTLDTFHGGRLLAVAFPWLQRLVLSRPGAARWVFTSLAENAPVIQLARFLEVNRHLLRREDLERYFKDLSEVDPEVFVRMLGAAAQHDASDHMPEVDVPTLVVGSQDDTFTPVALSALMHEMIPQSELLVLPAGTHVGPLEHPELVALRVEKFLVERVARVRTTRHTGGGRRPRRG
jgi:pimeloyl-ACP methyl ester carboxylesterase